MCRETLLDSPGFDAKGSAGARVFARRFSDRLLTVDSLTVSLRISYRRGGPEG